MTRPTMPARVRCNQFVFRGEPLPPRVLPVLAATRPAMKQQQRLALAFHPVMKFNSVECNRLCVHGLPFSAHQNQRNNLGNACAILHTPLAASPPYRFLSPQFSVIPLVLRPSLETPRSRRLSVSTTIENLRERPDDIAKELLRSIFFSMNWADSIDTSIEIRGPGSAGADLH